MEIINEDQIINARQTINAPQLINILPIREAQKFVATDTTPNVINNEYWIANNSGAITITQFDNGSECQELNILGEGFTTVANNANIKTNTGANKLLAANRMYRFVRFNSIWIEQ